jgi:hypothetical protein
MDPWERRARLAIVVVAAYAAVAAVAIQTWN